MLEPRKRAEQALVAVVREAYAKGVSTQLWGSCSISLTWPTRKEIHTSSDAETALLWMAWQSHDL
jgi:hypothetical protein